MTGLIDNTDTSILSNITTVTLARLITPITTTSSSYNINFNNAFFNPHSGHSTIVASTGFFINNTTATEYFFDDDGQGNVDGRASTQFRITVLPDSNDIIPVRNQLLEIDTVNTTVVGSVDATATTGRGYTVTTTGGASGGATTGSTTSTTTTVSTSSSTASSSSY